MQHRRTFSVAMDSVDAVGIAFYAAYWIWYEATFEDLVRVISGSTWSELLDSGFSMPVVHAEIDYLLPLHLSEEVTVEMRLVDIGTRSVHFEARFLREDEELAKARTVHVTSTRGALQAEQMPGWLVRALEGSVESLSRMDADRM